MSIKSINESQWQNTSAEEKLEKLFWSRALYSIKQYGIYFLGTVSRKLILKEFPKFRTLSKEVILEDVPELEGRLAELFENPKDQELIFKVNFLEIIDGLGLNKKRFIYKSDLLLKDLFKDLPQLKKELTDFFENPEAKVLNFKDDVQDIILGYDWPEKIIKRSEIMKIVTDAIKSKEKDNKFIEINLDDILVDDFFENPKADVLVLKDHFYKLVEDSKLSKNLKDVLNQIDNKAYLPRVAFLNIYDDSQSAHERLLYLVKYELYTKLLQYFQQSSKEDLAFKPEIIDEKRTIYNVTHSAEINYINPALAAKLLAMIEQSGYQGIFTIVNSKDRTKIFFHPTDTFTKKDLAKLLKKKELKIIREYLDKLYAMHKAEQEDYKKLLIIAHQISLLKKEDCLNLKKLLDKYSNDDFSKLDDKDEFIQRKDVTEANEMVAKMYYQDRVKQLDKAREEYIKQQNYDFKKIGKIFKGLNDRTIKILEHDVDQTIKGYNLSIDWLVINFIFDNLDYYNQLPAEITPIDFTFLAFTKAKIKDDQLFYRGRNARSISKSIILEKVPEVKSILNVFLMKSYHEDLCEIYPNFRERLKKERQKNVAANNLVRKIITKTEFLLKIPELTVDQLDEYFINPEAERLYFKSDMFEIIKKSKLAREVKNKLNEVYTKSPTIEQELQYILEDKEYIQIDETEREIKLKNIKKIIIGISGLMILVGDGNVYDKSFLKYDQAFTEARDFLIESKFHGEKYVVSKLEALRKYYQKIIFNLYEAQSRIDEEFKMKKVLYEKILFYELIMKVDFGLEKIALINVWQGKDNFLSSDYLYKLLNESEQFKNFLTELDSFMGYFIYSNKDLEIYNEDGVFLNNCNYDKAESEISRGLREKFNQKESVKLDDKMNYFERIIIPQVMDIRVIDRVTFQELIPELSDNLTEYFKNPTEERLIFKQNIEEIIAESNLATELKAKFQVILQNSALRRKIGSPRDNVFLIEQVSDYNIISIPTEYDLLGKDDVSTIITFSEYEILLLLEFFDYFPPQMFKGNIKWEMYKKYYSSDPTKLLKKENKYVLGELEKIINPTIGIKKKNVANMIIEGKDLFNILENKYNEEHLLEQFNLILKVMLAFYWDEFLNDEQKLEFANIINETGSYNLLTMPATQESLKIKDDKINKWNRYIVEKTKDDIENEHDETIKDLNEKLKDEFIQEAISYILELKDNYQTREYKDVSTKADQIKMFLQRIYGQD